MTKIFRESSFYYIAIPLVMAIWPLAIWQKYLPRASENWQQQEKRFYEATNLMEQILALDGDRLRFEDNKGRDKFDYTIAIDTAARQVGMPSTNYSISSRPIRTSGRERTQDCQIIIQQADIEQFAKFISNLQTTWASLRCEKITLTRTRGLPDAWKIDLTLKYYY
ncbi:MAG: hypothetical protein WCZ89_05590 [Phycisphaerae bacterium]